MSVSIDMLIFFLFMMVKTCKLVLYENNAFYKPKKCRQRFCGLKKNLQICVIKTVNQTKRIKHKWKISMN